MELLGAIITLLGSIFLLLGALGIVRMPDVYNRMQAGAKATTLGSIFFLLGISVGHHQCGCVGKVIILILFIVITNPISSNAIARASHFIGIKLADISKKDELQEDKNSGVVE